MTYTKIESSIGLGYLAIQYPYGSDFESPGSYGIAHLMEHLVCKSFDHLLPTFKRYGLDYNAFTSTNRTVFYLSGLNEYISKMGQEVYDCITTAGNKPCTVEAFEAEKKTVIQEIEDCFNDQESGTVLNLLRKHYNYFCPIGLKDDVSNFTYDDYVKQLSKYQVPSKICEVGDSYIKIPEFIVQPTEYQKLVFGNNDVPLCKVPKENKVVVGLLGNRPYGAELENRLDLIIKCLTSGIESPLYQEIRDKRGLSYFSIGCSEELSNSSILQFYSTTTIEREQELKEVYQEFFSGDLSRHITLSRFEECYEGKMIEKKKCQLLPHVWARVTMEKDPYSGLDSFGYDEAIQILNECFSLDKFEKFSY